MNEPLAMGTVVIIVLTSLCSWAGFRDAEFRDKYLFSVREILAGKQYHRLLISAFLHADWNHLLLNMISFYLFARHVELLLGVWKFLLIYFTAVVGGGLLSLWIHRQHEYQAYGASGGGCGMIFSHLFLFPGGSIYAFPLPIAIPSWLYTILFFVGSFIALRRQADNIGHDAHLGGAIIGLWTTAALEPWIVMMHPKFFLLVSTLSILLFAYLAMNPLFLSERIFLPDFLRRRSSPVHKRQTEDEEREMDLILEKISKTGLHSLDEREKARLNAISKKYQWRTESRKPKSELLF
jgi:membrane associated rhomboid family serine protease